MLVLFTMFCGSHALAVDIDGDGLEASVDFNDYVPRYQLTAGITHTCSLDDRGVSCWGDNDKGRSQVPELTSPMQVDAGGAFTCALDQTGVVCWGDNSAGQLAPPAMVDVVQISAGLNHACALHSGGVSCWGADGQGQSSGVPALNNPVLVSAGGRHTCALDDDGVKCWGDNGQSQAPALIGYLAGATQLVSGRFHSCALHSQGINCWGANSDGQTSTPAALRPIATSNPFRLAAGDYQTCALDDTGALCWGRSVLAEPLTASPSMTAPTLIAAGGYQACSLDQGDIKCWGYSSLARSGAHVLHELPETNQYSFSGFASTSFCTLASEKLTCWGTGSQGQMNIPTLTNPSSVVVGNQFNCALDDDGINCWGKGDSGATTVPAMTAPTTLVTGGEHVCALDDGVPVCWGSNTSGRATPPVLSAMTHLASGYVHSCAWNDAAVECWGSNTSGQAGSHALTSTSAVTMGNSHTCALSDAGVTCWGSNTYSQLSVPAEISSPISIDSGSNHTCVLSPSGVQCWGRNNAGQTEVPPLTNPVEITADGNASCAVDDSGVVCWGATSSGLGEPPTGGNPHQLMHASGTACVLSDDGLQCWGDYAQQQAFANASPSFADADGDGLPDDIDTGPFDPSVGGTLSADAGGPYEKLQHQSFSLNGAASATDSPDVTLQHYRWDKDDGDGIHFDVPDAEGITASTSYAAIGVYALNLQVTDSVGRIATAATTVTILADTDADGTADSEDLYPTDSAAATDDDGDGLPDDCVSAQLCIDAGLIPDPSLNDFDNDGIITSEDSDDTVDTAPPTVIAPSAINIIATGSNTIVDLLQNGMAYASDFPSIVLTALPNTDDNATTISLVSGRHLIDWCAIDAADNVGCDTQTVDVTPLVTFLSTEQMTAEGVDVEVIVELSGNPISYPVTIPIIVNLANSTAINPEDHNATNSSVAINVDDVSDDLDENTGRLSFSTVDDGVTGEVDEVVELTLVADNGTASLVGAALGNELLITHRLTISEENIAPAVTLMANSSISLANVNADYSIQINDPNNHSDYLVSWYFDGTLLESGTNLTELTHSLADVEEGTYTLRVTVLDSGSPAKQGEAETNISYTTPFVEADNGESGGGAIAGLLIGLLVLSGRFRKSREP